MSVPPLPLPSDKTKVIYFSEPDVKDALDFCELNEELEELSTTSYLNQLQKDKDRYSDSALWTAQDRRTALWWIFLASSPDHEVAYSYECQHCGEMHYPHINLEALDDELAVLDIPPYIKDDLFFAGKLKKVSFHNPDGRAMEHMEETRVARDQQEPDSPKYKRLAAELRVLEVIHSFSLDEDNDLTFDEQLKRKIDLVTTMRRGDEFATLADKSSDATQKLRHGLLCEINDGRINLISPPLPCEQKNDGREVAGYTRILMRFHSIQFMPEI